MNREMPQNIEAEQSVIGSMLLSKSAIVQATESLVGDCFYLDKHAKIFNAIKKLYENSIPVDFTTITNELKDKNTIKDMQGKYSLEYAQITDVPCLIIFEDGKLKSIYSIKDKAIDVEVDSGQNSCRWRTLLTVLSKKSRCVEIKQGLRP